MLDYCMTSAIVLFTGKSREQIIADGGTGRWLVSENVARQHEYVVCIRNKRAANFPNAEPHGSAFLIGRLKSVTKTETDKNGNDRYFLQLKDWTALDLPNRWKNWRNPVKYSSLEELDISIAGLTFQQLPDVKIATSTELGANLGTKSQLASLTIPQAKEGLARHFGVPVEAIEITIKG